METPIRILGIAGSLRRGSYNRAALRAATELAPKGVTVETFELGGIPPFDQDEERNPPAKVTELKRRVREANAILCGPEKHIRRCLINEGHQPFSAPHVFGVLRAKRARQRILLHIHAVNESRANRQNYDKQRRPVAQSQS
jgi:hypothetical protein